MDKRVTRKDFLICFKANLFNLSFQKRWKSQLTFKTGQNLAINRFKALNKKTAKDFYQLLSDLFKELGKTYYLIILKKRR